MARTSGLAVACTLIGAVALAAAAGIGGCGSDEFTGESPDGGSSGDQPPIFGSDTGASSSGSSGNSSSGSSGNGPNNCVPPKVVEIAPAATTHTVNIGTPYSLPFTAKADGADVTSQVNFTVNDANVGTFTGATFNWGGKYGGALTVSAKLCGVVGTATLDLKLVAPTFTAGNGASGLAAEFAAAPASTNAACKPTLKYPPDKILLPPNTNVIEVHFLEATGNNKFEISFTNAVTDVRVYTTCTAPLVGGQPDAANGAPAPGVTGGCLFELNQAEWDYIANTNREGQPLNVSVRALGCDGGNAASSDTRQISFAKQDVIGTIYYWASIRINGTTNSGGVYRYDYGKRGQIAEAVLTPVADVNGNGGNSNGLCVGCHLVDREGRKMVFDFDDNDSDDEYGDMWTSVWDIPKQTSTSVIAKGSPNSFSAGYSSWNRSASKFLKSDGWGNGSAGEGAGAVPFSGKRGTFHVVSNLGVPVAKIEPADLTVPRGSTPDISPDDKKVVFSAMANQEGGPTTPGFFGSSAHNNVAPDGFTDEYFSGAGLYLSTWDSATNAMGAPTAIFPAAAANAADPGNYYYPSWSPDGNFIAFNYATSGANYHNPRARFMLVSATGNVAADQHKANETTPNENGGLLTNSWVRWAPFIQDYKGKKLAWVTFSSTRSYGLRIDNNAQIDCYPKENPNTTVYPLFTSEPNCSRAQLWMAAIDLDTGKVAAGGDVSFPAFWLPFQDRTTNNHLGQWTQKNFKGTCSPTNPCPTGYVCDNDACAAIPPTNTTPPPPADCTNTPQCATGTCCVSGKCDACADSAAPPKGCNTCLDCGGQACKGGNCGDCTSSSDCCAPLVCMGGSCVKPVN